MFFLKKTSLSETARGFTIVELLVSIAIFTILTTMMITQYGTTDASAKLNQAENQVVSAIKEARQNSVTIVEYGEDGSGIFPSYGVGLEREGESIILYADCELDDDGNGTIDDRDNFIYNPGSSNCAVGNADGLVESIPLIEGTHIESLQTFSDGIENLNEVYIEYVRPLPDVWISDENADPLPFGRLEITLGADRSEEMRVVVVYTSGLITSKTP